MGMRIVFFCYFLHLSGFEVSKGLLVWGKSWVQLSEGANTPPPSGVGEEGQFCMHTV